MSLAPLALVLSALLPLLSGVLQHAAAQPFADAGTFSPLEASPNYEIRDIDATEMLATINAERASRALPQLTLDVRLCAIARSHAEDMVQRRYFSHMTPEGLSPFARMARAHYSFSYAGENLALDQSVAAAGEALWLSSEHRENILQPHFSRVGIAAVNATDGEIFVEDFSD